MTLTKLNVRVTRLYRGIPAAGVHTIDRQTVEKEKQQMKTKFCGVALLALMLCGTGALSYAQGPGGFGGHGGVSFRVGNRREVCDVAQIGGRIEYLTFT